MATTPVPRSFSDILGDMIDAFLSRFGLRSLKVGSPVLSILESVAQSQLRSSEDIFTLLEAQSLDNASGDALDRIGADESTPRITQNPASGLVSFSDTTFSKISSKVFQGTPAPIVGSTAINIVDASSFPNTGSIYIGRGTTQTEGQLAYTSKTNNGTYWTLALSTPTLRFHNQGESVVVAQGGDRQIPAGTQVQTPQGNTAQAIQFKTIFSATIQDGEVSVDNVFVVALKPGVSGNVAAMAITGFVGAKPFTNATVTNSLPFTNGTSVEDDDSYRERIREARQSRTKGTALAIQTNAVGVTSNSENKRVLSASVVTRQSYPTTLYIDDGAGYEMKASGIAIETLIDSALGGEQYFKVSQRPIAKAYVQATLSAPFNLNAGMKLGFAVDGIATEHTFDGTQFRNITNATAYEIVASINSDASLNWQARTVSNGLQVQVTAKVDTNESIQLQAIDDGVDANPFLGFPAGRVDTMRLYLDDRLLSKDGRTASITSQSTALWATLTGPQSLIIAVDGIVMSFDGIMFQKFRDVDFVNANTGYTTVGKNSPAAWAAVFNSRIPGITASVEADVIVLTSNRSHLASGQLQIISGDLVTNHMFLTGISLGANSDYTLNRNTGELSLKTAMNAGQKLTTGSSQTRAFLNTSAITTITLAANANMWFAIDASAQIIPNGVSATTTLTFTSSATGYGFLEKCTASSASFTNVLQGDWVIFWDSAVSGSLFGAYRVTAVDVGGTYFYFEKATSYTGVVTFNQVGIQFARTNTNNPLLKQVIAAGSLYTAASFANSLDSSLVGGFASTYRTNILRVRTNTFSDVNGDIALVAADINGQKVGLPLANGTKNLTGHMASVESGNSEIGTPDFHASRITAVSSQTAITVARLPNDIPSTGRLLNVLRGDQTSTTAETGNRWSSQFGFRTTIAAAAVNGGNWDLTLNKGPEQTWMVLDRFMYTNMYMMSPNDQFTVLIDGDTTLKRFTIPMWRTIKATSSTYAVTNTFTDADNSNQSLTVAFGSSYTFNDFTIYMAARGKTDAADGTKAVLWRYYRLGPDGNNARIQYKNPDNPNGTVAFQTDNITNATLDIKVMLAGGAQRTTSSIRASTRVGVYYPSITSGWASTTYVVGFSVASGVRASVTPTLTLSLPASCTDHGLQIGDHFYTNSTDVNYPSGSYTVQGRTPTTITYVDTSVSVAALAGTATVSADNLGEATLTGSSAIVGDFYRLIGSGLDSIRITTLNAQNWSGSIKHSGSPTTVVAWGSAIGDPSLFLMFANPAQTAATIVTAAAALNGVVKPTLISNGSGVIDRSSDETASAANTFVSLVDGINYVKTTTPPGGPGNYTLVFKNPVDSTLTTNSDWTNEIVRVSPSSAANIVEWFNTLGVTGLSSVADIEASTNASKVQISSLTPGSIGSVQVQGGMANAASATILGSAVITPGGMVVSVPAANVSGLYAGMHVSIDNENTLPKSGVFDTNTTLNTLTTGGVFTFDSGATAVVTRRSTTSNAGLKFEQEGPFVCIIDTTLGAGALSLGSVVEGDYINVITAATPSSLPQVASGNTGLYRIIRVLAPYFGASPGAVWIENANFVAQNLAECDIAFIASNSVLPGDVIQISTSLWNVNNLGAWAVTTVPGITLTGSRFTFTVDVTQKTPTAIGSTVGALGSTNASLVQCVEGIASHFVKRILGISPNSVSLNIADVKFSTSANSGLINATAGSVISAYDKLGFNGDLSIGIDGYQYNTGLIQEVNRVEYGDPSDSATYPGVIAAGANVNTEGAPIKRIQVGIALRARSGANTTFISQSAKSAVAAVINGTGVGKPIALIDIATAAKVPGVISVIMLSPQMVTGSDLISIQSFEKPLVLDLDQDILISFVGD